MTVADLEARMSVTEFNSWAAYLAIKAERNQVDDHDLDDN